MKLTKVSSLGKDNKVAYNVAGERFFIPEALRPTAKVGSHAIVIERSFTQRSKRDDDNNPIPDEYEPCEAWTRNDITFFGTREEALSAKTESALMEVEEEAFVAQAKVNISKTYSLATASAADLV